MKLAHQVMGLALALCDRRAFRRQVLVSAKDLRGAARHLLPKSTFVATLEPRPRAPKQPMQHTPLDLLQVLPSNPTCMLRASWCFRLSHRRHVLAIAMRSTSERMRQYLRHPQSNKLQLNSHTIRGRSSCTSTILRLRTFAGYSPGSTSPTASQRIICRRICSSRTGT